MLMLWTSRCFAADVKRGQQTVGEEAVIHWLINVAFISNFTMKLKKVPILITSAQVKKSFVLKGEYFI